MFRTDSTFLDHQGDYKIEGVFWITDSKFYEVWENNQSIEEDTSIYFIDKIDSMNLILISEEQDTFYYQKNYRERSEEAQEYYKNNRANK